MKKKQPAPIEWILAQPPVGPSVITNLEHRFSVQLPRDYVECAMQHHGGHPNRECFDFKGRREAVFNRLLPLTGKTARIDMIWDAIKDRLPARVFPFASDPCGNYLCFDYRKTGPRVVFWDHEIAAKDIKKAMQPLCDSFTEFLGMLYTPED